VDVAYNYTFDVTLTANQVLLNQQVPILPTADFVWRGLVFPLVVQAGTVLPVQPFKILFYDGNQYALSPSRVPVISMITFPSDPFPYYPEVWYPAGGKILIDIEDTSGTTNDIQLLFVGANRYSSVNTK
jgi:hypothetical protein